MKKKENKNGEDNPQNNPNKIEKYQQKEANDEITRKEKRIPINNKRKT